MSTPKPLLNVGSNRRQTSSQKQSPSPRKTNLKLQKTNSATDKKGNGSPKLQQRVSINAAALPAKLTSKQSKKQSEMSELSMLKIGRRTSSSRGS